MIRKCSLWAIGIVPFVLTGVGCNKTQPPVLQAQATDSPQPAKAAETPKDADHGHQPGAHGGMIVPVGRDNYHAEAVFEKDGVLRLHMLGKDESRIQEVEAQTLTVYVKPEGTTLATPVVLQADPQPGDANGKTSRFVGQLPGELTSQNLEVTVPNIKIAGERFRFSFQTVSATHEAQMPAKVADDEERKLYLTPGGKYTEADIRANGNMTVSQKYKGFMSAHDMHPKPGMKICPVTMTKANAQCSWIIGGKTYEFCCPPCIDEFVKTAKENPEAIKDPQDYVQK